jgi:cephalosporin-C deacetylase-like acetyl esterase
MIVANRDRRARSAPAVHRAAVAFASLLVAALTPSGPSLTAQPAPEEDLNVIGGWMRFTDAPNALYHHLSRDAFDLLDARSRRVSALGTPADWRLRQEEIRRALEEIVGPLPARTPLNARITGVVRKSAFRMEKVVFESMPGFHVTGIVFVPEGVTDRRPAILYASGHAALGFRTSTYLHVIQNLVRKGFIVFAFDPVGQGERIQHWDPEQGGSRVGGPTLEHSYPGAQCFISGRSLARYMIWDGIRALDYLVGRDDVDPARLGVTGRSGGGTQTAYIAALDERVAAAAPENYITSFRRLIETRGVQDAEQNFLHGMLHGIDMADLLALRAPRPTLMITTTRDIFSIQGAREVFAEVRPAFRALGGDANFTMVEDDDRHASTRTNRESMYGFFQEALGLPGSSRDEDVPELPLHELQVTATGQVSTSMGGETIFSLNRAETEPQFAAMQASRLSLGDHLSRVRSAGRDVSGYRAPAAAADHQAVFTGRWHRDGYVVEMFFIPGEGDYVIPFLVFVPHRATSHPAVVYLHPEGKAADAAPEGPIEQLVNRGYLVLAPDLIGIGELGPGQYRGDAYDFKPGPVSYNLWFAALQIGRSITGIRAGDIVRTVHYLRSRDDVDPGRIQALARGEVGAALLHAAVFEDMVRSVALIDPLVSWAELVRHQYYRTYHVPHAVPGALGHYDLPDLAAALAPRRLLVLGVADHQGRPAGPELIDREMEVVRRAYIAAGADDGLSMRPADPAGFARQAAEWFEEAR